MTDEAIILDTAKYIKLRTNPPTFIDISKTIWYNLSESKKEYLREMMRTKPLINLNQNYHWEVQLRSEAYSFISAGDKKLEKDFIKYLKKQTDIKLFMESHFIKPDPTSPETTNETDNGVNFLKGLKYGGLINYEDEDLRHVNGDWYEDPPKNTKKRWFNTLHQPMLVSIKIQPKGDFFNKIPKQNKIKATHKNSIISLFSHRSIYWWAALMGIIGGAITLWIFVLSPIVKSIIEYFSN